MKILFFLKSLLLIIFIQPLEIREAIPSKSRKVDLIGFCNFASIPRSNWVFRIANAIEYGRAVARDIGGSDPERMSAPKVAEYVQLLFEHTPVNVQIINDAKQIEKEFPCLGNNNLINLNVLSLIIIQVLLTEQVLIGIKQEQYF